MILLPRNPLVRHNGSGDSVMLISQTSAVVGSAIRVIPSSKSSRNSVTFLPARGFWQRDPRPGKHHT